MDNPPESLQPAPILEKTTTRRGFLKWVIPTTGYIAASLTALIAHKVTEPENFATSPVSTPTKTPEPANPTSTPELIPTMMPPQPAGSIPTATPESPAPSFQSIPFSTSTPVSGEKTLPVAISKGPVDWENKTLVEKGTTNPITDPEILAKAAAQKTVDEKIRTSRTELTPTPTPQTGQAETSPTPEATPIPISGSSRSVYTPNYIKHDENDSESQS